MRLSFYGARMNNGKIKNKKEKKHKCIICGSMTVQYYFIELDLFENIEKNYKPSICNFSPFCNIKNLDISEIYQRRTGV